MDENNLENVWRESRSWEEVLEDALLLFRRRGGLSAPLLMRKYGLSFQKAKQLQDEVEKKFMQQKTDRCSDFDFGPSPIDGCDKKDNGFK